MAEYIKRDVVTKGIMVAKWVDGYDGAMAMEIAASAPTVDVAPVVRCKDCKWDRPDTLLDKHWCSRLLGCMEVRADDFCSYGKRKEGETDGS